MTKTNEEGACNYFAPPLNTYNLRYILDGYKLLGQNTLHVNTLLQ